MNIRISAFIVVSCLAHAGLLCWPQRAEVPALNIGGEARALRITLASGRSTSAAEELAALETRSPDTPPQVTPQQPRLAAGERPEQHIAPAPVQRPGATTARQTPQQNTAKAPDGGRQTMTREADRSEPQPSSLSVSERVSAALQSQLAEAFDYPWLARKRGWQGLVTLSLHIDEDGALTRWKIVHTSGYSLLDHSALQAAQRIGRLQRADTLLNGQSLNLSIPVRYQLLDS